MGEVEFVPVNGFVGKDTLEIYYSNKTNVKDRC